MCIVDTVISTWNRWLQLCYYSNQQDTLYYTFCTGIACAIQAVQLVAAPDAVVSSIYACLALTTTVLAYVTLQYVTVGFVESNSTVTNTAPIDQAARLTTGTGVQAGALQTGVQTWLTDTTVSEIAILALLDTAVRLKVVGVYAAGALILRQAEKTWLLAGNTYAIRGVVCFSAGICADIAIQILVYARQTQIVDTGQTGILTGQTLLYGQICLGWALLDTCHIVVVQTTWTRQTACCLPLTSQTVLVTWTTDGRQNKGTSRTG